jgi:hypothetical protein
MSGSAAGFGSWGVYVLLTVLCWGSYGVLLHTGQVAMGDPENGRYKAFLFVGLAYLATAVLAPAALLWLKGADWSVTTSGANWSLVAGVAGAIGAFSVLLAFGAKGSPAVVMSLVFCGAPMVNALIAITLHKQWGEIRWPFLLGIALAAIGAYMVVAFKPGPSSAAPPESPPAAQATGVEG